MYIQKLVSGLVRFFSVAVLSSIFFLPTLSQAGNLPWEVWALINGTSVQDFLNSGATNNPPDAVYTISNAFDTFNVGNTDDHADDYGSRIRGFLQVPETGTYCLCLSSADGSQLSFSTNFDPANATLVAQETNSGAPLFADPRLAQRTSPALNLVKGQSYYLEILHKAGVGSDYIRVGWQTPEGIQQIIPALYLLPWSPDATTPALTDQPASTNVIEGDAIILNTTVQAQQPATFQWYKDGQPLNGENIQSLVIPEADQTNAGQYYLEVTDANNNTVASSNAVVNVLPDTTPPSVVSVELNSRSNLLTVVFSEKVDLLSATNTVNYELNNGATLSAGNLATDGVTVIFNVTGLAAGQSNFSVSVGGVADRHHNVISPVVFPVDLVWTETFSGGVGYFTAANNNHTNGNNFDYSFSINAGGGVGELGGTFARSTTAAAGYLADPSLGGAISLTNNLVIRGQIFIHNINANDNFFFGFTPSIGSFSSPLGVQIAEPNSTFAPNFRAKAIANGTASAQHALPPDVAVPFSLNWNAASGVLTANIGNQQLLSTNSGAGTVYQTFQIATYGESSAVPADTVSLYFDNLTYSVGSVRAVPVYSGPTVGVTQQQPVDGQIFPRGSSITLAARALTSAQPITDVQFYSQTGSATAKVGEVANTNETNILFASTWSSASGGNYILTSRAITSDSLTATSAPISIYVVSPQPLGSVTEPFDAGLGRFQTQMNSQSLGNNFGFSNTGNAGGATAGEAGGLFVRSVSPSYLADTNAGALYPELYDLDLSGQLYLQNNNWNGTVFVGYVNSTNLNARFGINISEPSSSSGTAFRGSVVIGSASSATVNFQPGTPIPFSLHWSVTNQTVTGTLAGQPISLPYVPATEFFNTVIIGTPGNGSDINTAQVNFFVDDLSYTTVSPAAVLGVNIVNGQAVLSWTAAGFKLQHSDSLGANASWTDDGSPTVVNGTSTVTQPLTGAARFWRLAPQ